MDFCITNDEFCIQNDGFFGRPIPSLKAHKAPKATRLQRNGKNRNIVAPTQNPSRSESRTLMVSVCPQVLLRSDLLCSDFTPVELDCAPFYSIVRSIVRRIESQRESQEPDLHAGAITAYCNTNALFSRNFLLKMQKERPFSGSFWPLLELICHNRVL